MLYVALRFAEEERVALPRFALGWPLEAVTALVFVAAVLGWFPAYHVVMVYLNTVYSSFMLLVIVLAISSTVVAVLIGEMLRQRRWPTFRSFIDGALLAAVSVLALGNVVIVYSSAHAYEQALDPVGMTTHSIGGSIARTILSMLGTTIAITATYHRESLIGRRSARRIRRLRDDIARAEERLRMARRSL